MGQAIRSRRRRDGRCCSTERGEEAERLGQEEIVRRRSGAEVVETAEDDEQETRLGQANGEPSVGMKADLGFDRPPGRLVACYNYILVT